MRNAVFLRRKLSERVKSAEIKKCQTGDITQVVATGVFVVGVTDYYMRDTLKRRKIGQAQEQSARWRICL